MSVVLLVTIALELTANDLRGFNLSWRDSELTYRKKDIRHYAATHGHQTSLYQTQSIATIGAISGI